VTWGYHEPEREWDGYDPDDEDDGPPPPVLELVAPPLPPLPPEPAPDTKPATIVGVSIAEARRAIKRAADAKKGKRWTRPAD
jgi:hypothetical protein